jgi:hypothetical protein
MHDAIMADAARPARVSILKLPMLDYSIGHEIVLWQRRNAFVTHLPDSFDELPLVERIKALQQAVLVCCEKIPRSARFWAWRCRNLDMLDEMKKFREYRAAGSLDLPQAKIPKVAGAHYHYFGSPETAQLLNYVSSRHQAMISAHFEGSPLNFPFGLARILYMTDAETSGAIWIKNFHDMETERRKEAFEKLHPESTLAVGSEAVQASAEKWNREHPECPVPLSRSPIKPSAGELERRKAMDDLAPPK